MSKLSKLVKRALGEAVGRRSLRGKREGRRRLLDAPRRQWNMPVTEPDRWWIRLAVWAICRPHLARTGEQGLPAERASS
jgi:hypothetical protein